jgi:hypothetical protein
MAKTLSSPWILPSILEIIYPPISPSAISIPSTTHLNSSRSLPANSSSTNTPHLSLSFSLPTPLSSHPTNQFPITRRPKIVQVLRVYPEERILIINDQSHTVAVFLSSSCLYYLSHFLQFDSIQCLQNSIIKLDIWHFSTVLQCLHDRNFHSLTKIGITLPLAINCSKLSSFGAFDCNPIGSPVDINKVRSPVDSSISPLLISDSRTHE